MDVPGASLQQPGDALYARLTGARQRLCQWPWTDAPVFQSAQQCRYRSGPGRDTATATVEHSPSAIPLPCGLFHTKFESVNSISQRDEQKPLVSGSSVVSQ